jgi:hypothetical protein
VAGDGSDGEGSLHYVAGVAEDERSTVAVVDGGMISGWRRQTPSLEQLHQAVCHLHASHPGVLVAVIADPALKHALPASDQPRLDADIEVGAVVLAPAGTLGGFTEFLTNVARRAAASGLRPIVVTDQSVPGPLGRVRVDGGRWLFDLAGSTARTDAGKDRHQRRRRSPS